MNKVENPVVGLVKQAAKSRVGKVALVAAAALTAAGCARQSESTPTPILPPTLPSTPTPCNPDAFVQEHKITTPVPVGGGENVPEDIVNLRKKIDSCQTLTEAQQNRLIVFNRGVLEQKAAAEAAMTAQAQRPTPTRTPTPEVVKQVDCVILPKEYCSQAVIFEWTHEGRTYALIGFRELPPNVPIHSPFKGPLSTTGNHLIKPEARAPSVIESSTGELTGKEERGFVAVGNLEPRAAKGGMVEKGDVIAVTGNTGDKVAGDFALVLAFNRLRQGQVEMDAELIKQLFPHLKLK